MKLFLPNPRAINVLLIIGFCSVGYALYLRYLVIEQSSVSLAWDASFDRWGLGYQVLSEKFPGLIYCCVSGFGADGLRHQRRIPGRAEDDEGLRCFGGMRQRESS